MRWLLVAPFVLFFLPGQAGAWPLRDAFFRTTGGVECILENADPADVIEQLKVFYPDVKFIPHPVLNGFFVVGPEKDVLAILRLLPSMDLVTAVFSPPNPEGVFELLQSRVPEAACSLKDGRITLRVTREQLDRIYVILEENSLPRPGVLHFRRQKDQ